MSDLQVLLVGTHFYPPAKALVPLLPLDTELWLEAEPENPYDPLAIAVFLPLLAQHLPLLEQVCLPFGLDPAETMELGQLKLGHIASSAGKICKKTGTPGNAEVFQLAPSGFLELLAAKLAVDLSGAPAVALEVLSEPEEEEPWEEDAEWEDPEEEE